MSEKRTIGWGPTARASEPHDFVADDRAGHNPRWCKVCGWAADSYLHASEEERAAFDATQS